MKKDTLRVFNDIKGLPLLSEYMLIGGTALSMQIGHRTSEDLDFCKWQNDPAIKSKEIRWPEIEKELKSLGNVKTDILDFYQVYFYLEGVKISFYSNALTSFREVKTGLRDGVVRVADIQSIGAMKLEVMMRRFLFRDYYDVYSVLQEGIPLKDLVNQCGRYSRHRMKTKMILGILSNGSLFEWEEGFGLLEPRYDVNSGDIESYIKCQIRGQFGV